MHNFTNKKKSNNTHIVKNHNETEIAAVPTRLAQKKKD